MAWFDHSGSRIQGARSYQEDSFSLCEFPGRGGTRSGLLLVLADGMGGHEGGALASEAAVGGFVESFHEAGGSVGESLRSALDAANAAVAARRSEAGERGQMGCTLVGAFVSPDGLEWVSVGDSPLWLARAAGGLERLNADHSMKPVLERMVEAGQLTREAALQDPSRNALRAALTGDPLELVDGPAGPAALEPGDAVVLASDGILTLSDDEIEEHAVSGLPASEIVERLLSAIAARGEPDQDNATVLVASAGKRPGRIATAARIVALGVVCTLAALALATVAASWRPKPARPPAPEPEAAAAEAAAPAPLDEQREARQEEAKP